VEHLLAAYVSEGAMVPLHDARERIEELEQLA